jgi:hypothetical protein
MDPYAFIMTIDDDDNLQDQKEDQPETFSNDFGNVRIRKCLQLLIIRLLKNLLFQWQLLLLIFVVTFREMKRFV